MKITALDFRSQRNQGDITIVQQKANNQSWMKKTGFISVFFNGIRLRTCLGICQLIFKKKRVDINTLLRQKPQITHIVPTIKSSVLYFGYNALGGPEPFCHFYLWQFQLDTVFFKEAHNPSNLPEGGKQCPKSGRNVTFYRQKAFYMPLWADILWHNRNAPLP